MRYVLALLTALPLLAVDGTAINQTTGQPQSDVQINLVQPGEQGMKSLGAFKTGADGKFKIDAEIPPGPALLQSTYRGVMYTQAIPPGTPRSGLTINVYEASAEPPAGMTTQHLVLLEPSATQLRVTETFFTRNESKITYQDTANGSLRMYLPEGVPADLKINIDSTGVPIQRPVEKGKRPGEYRVDYALKPGDTRFDLEYILPASATFSNKVFSNDPATKIVTPASVTLSGDGIKDLGQEPQTQARVYTFDGTSFKVNISGVGSIRTPSDAPPAEESGAPKCCDESPARVETQRWWILGLAFAILLAGGTILFRKGTA
jgi:hypothetical protein